MPPAQGGHSVHLPTSEQSPHFNCFKFCTCILEKNPKQTSPLIRHRRTDQYFFLPPSPAHRRGGGGGWPQEEQGAPHHGTAVPSCTHWSPARLGYDPPSCWTLTHSKHSRPVQRNRQLTCKFCFASKIHLLNSFIIAAVLNLFIFQAQLS